MDSKRVLARNTGKTVVQLLAFVSGENIVCGNDADRDEIETQNRSMVSSLVVRFAGIRSLLCAVLASGG